jgi:hypothetical protein
VKTTLTCPLGHTCQKSTNDGIEQCAWYVKLQGQDKQGNDHDEWGCAISWMPILQVEVAGTNRGQTAAIESLRNETTKRQTLAIQAMNRGLLKDASSS